MAAIYTVRVHLEHDERPSLRGNLPMGSYASVAEANRAVLAHMLNSESSYKAGDDIRIHDDERLEMITFSSNGQTRRVYVEKVDLPAATCNACSIAAPPPSQLLYIVYHRIIDYHMDRSGDMRHTFTIGTYDSLTGANEAARDCLIKGGPHRYVKYKEVYDVNGVLEIKAICTEGEDYRVYIETVQIATDIPAHSIRQSRMKALPSQVYTVSHMTLTAFEAKSPSAIRKWELSIPRTFESIKDANRAAYNHLRLLFMREPIGFDEDEDTFEDRDEYKYQDSDEEHIAELHEIARIEPGSNLLSANELCNVAARPRRPWLVNFAEAHVKVVCAPLSRKRASAPERKRTRHEDEGELNNIGNKRRRF